MDALIPQHERAFEERRNVVNRPAVAGVAADHNAVDHRPVGSGSVSPLLVAPVM